jgi:hypothetical protein
MQPEMGRNNGNHIIIEGTEKIQLSLLFCQYFMHVFIHQMMQIQTIMSTLVRPIYQILTCQEDSIRPTLI